MESLIGRRLGNYRIDSLIGQGGMGAVYRGTHVSLDRPVAIKTLLPELSANGDFSSRFLREAQVASRVRHPRLVQVYDFGSEDGITYLVMDYLEGTPLDQLIDGGVLTTQRSIGLLGQIGEAVDYIHSQGIAHRDLKPANIIVDTRDRITIVDFGLARSVDSASITTTGMFPGTPAYMAPERFRSGDPEGRTSDQFAIGVIAYEMLTGKRPFDGSDISQILYQIMSSDPPLPSTTRPDLARYDAIVLRQMAKEANQRYPSATTFVNALAHGDAATQMGFDASTQYVQSDKPPTVAASPPNLGKPGEYPPTVLGNPPQSPGYGTPPNTPGYSAPPNTPGYGTPPNTPGYGAPAYGAPPAPAYGAAPVFSAPPSYPPAPAPRKRSRLGCIFGIVAALGLLACVGAVGIFTVLGGLAAIGIAIGDPSSTAESFMTAIKNSDWNAAYDLCDPALKDELGSPTAIRDYIAGNQYQPTTWKLSVTNNVEEYAEMTGPVTLSGNRPGSVDLYLLKIDGVWKISAFDLYEE